MTTGRPYSCIAIVPSARSALWRSPGSIQRGVGPEPNRSRLYSTRKPSCHIDMQTSGKGQVQHPPTMCVLAKVPDAWKVVRSADGATSILGQHCYPVARLPEYSERLRLGCIRSGFRLVLEFHEWRRAHENALHALWAQAKLRKAE